MNIQASAQITDLKDDKEKFRYIQLFLESTQNTVNGKLELLKNLKISFKEVKFQAINADVFIEHGLGTTPTGYIICGANDSMVLYDGSQPANNTTIVLRTNDTGTARILFF